MDDRYLAAAAVCGALFLLLEGEAVRCILRGAGYSRGFVRGLVYSASDIYFSAVTPSATGGSRLPARCLMMRDTIPAGVVTATLVVNLVLYTLSIVLLGLGAVVTSFPLLFGFRLLSKILIGVGFAILTGLTLFFLRFWARATAPCSACCGTWPGCSTAGSCSTDWTTGWDGSTTPRGITTPAPRCERQTVTLVKAFFLSFFQRAAQIAVPMFTYMALGGSVHLAPGSLPPRAFVTVGYNCVPIPGAMGRRTI